jgi:hypothetical protein
MEQSSELGEMDSGEGVEMAQNVRTGIVVSQEENRAMDRSSGSSEMEPSSGPSEMDSGQGVEMAQNVRTRGVFPRDEVLRVLGSGQNTW